MPSNEIEENKNISIDKSIDYCFGDYGEEIISKIASILGISFTPKYNTTGVTYYGNKGRILKVVKRQRYLEVEFNVPVSEVLDLAVLTEEERIDKHMGTCRWVYKGDNLTTVLKLVEEAAEKY